MCFVFFLQSFIGTDITFAVRPYFRGPFCSDDIRESLVVSHIKHVLNSAQVFLLLYLIFILSCCISLK